MTRVTFCPSCGRLGEHGLKIVPHDKRDDAGKVVETTVTEYLTCRYCGETSTGQPAHQMAAAEPEAFED